MNAPLVLIVEDDPNKEAAIRSAILSTFPELRIEVRRSYQSGLAFAITEKPQIVLLDMTLPTWQDPNQDASGRARPFGGEEILRRLRKRGVRTRAIVVTQFESFGEGPEAKSLGALDAALRRDYPNLYCGYVFYEPTGTSWRGPLLDYLNVQLDRR